MHLRSIVQPHLRSHVQAPANRLSYLDYGDYALFMPFAEGKLPEDKVSRNALTTTLPGKRYDTVNGVLTEFAVDDPVITELGLRGGGVVENLVWPSEDVSSDVMNALTVISTNNESPSSVANAVMFTRQDATSPIYTRPGAVTVTPETTYTYSIYIKNIDASEIDLRVWNVNASAEIANKPIISELSTNEFMRVSLTFTTPLNCTSVYIYRMWGLNIGGSVIIWGLMLNEGTYPLPYVPTTDATVTTVTEAGSADYGNRLENLSTDFPQLYDVLDGEADGVELLDGWDFTNGWLNSQVVGVEILDANSFSTTVSAAGIVYDILDENTYYKITCLGNTTGSLGISLLGAAKTEVSTDFGVYRFKTTDETQLYLRNAIAGTTSISILSVQKISPAAGSLHCEWTPLYASSAFPPSSNSALLSVREEISDLLLTYSTSSSARLASSDDVNFIIQTITWQANTTYELAVVFGNHPTEGNNKFQVGIREKGTTIWTWGSLADFDGSFDPTDVLNFFWSNDYHSYIKNLMVLKANQYRIPVPWQPTIPEGYTQVVDESGQLLFDDDGVPIIVEVS